MKVLMYQDLSQMYQDKITSMFSKRQQLGSVSISLLVLKTLRAATCRCTNKTKILFARTKASSHEQYAVETADGYK